MTIKGYNIEKIKWDFLELYKEVPPTFTKFKNDFVDGKFYLSPYTIRDRFVRYSDFLKYCGYETVERINKRNRRVGMICEIRESKRKKIVHYSKEKVKEIFYNHFKDLQFVNEKVISQEYNKGSIPFGYGIIKRKFGNLQFLEKELGLFHLINSRRHAYFTKEEMINFFKKAFPNFNLPPTQLEVTKKYYNKEFLFSVDNLSYNFGSYSKFLIEAGYDYNKGKYSQKYLTKDGKICDSKSEYKIDEFFHKNGINHKHQPKYKDIIDGFEKLSKADFLLNDGTVVEYFGLVGQPKYDKKVRKKVNVLEKNNIRYIDLYPNDLKKLNEIFKDYVRGCD